MDQLDQADEYAFHRLGRSWPHYRWWKPLLTGLLGIAIYFAFVVVLLLVSMVIALATSADVQQYADPQAAIDLSDPVIFALTLGSLIIMIPALVLATLIMGPKPIGLLSSVAGRIRWRWLGVCALVTIGIYALSFGISVAVGSLFPSEGAPIPQPDNSTMLILLTLTILAVPFQAAAEEYVFRGYLMQLIGGWLKHPAFAILLPVPLFVAGHLYDVLGQVDVALFAIFAGWITWRTGGLEAAIAVHAINNMTIFALGAVGLADVNATEGSIDGLVVSVLTMALTAFVIVKLANGRGIERTRTVTAAPVKTSPGWPGSTTLPTGDGVWHQSPPQQIGGGRPGAYQGAGTPQHHAHQPYDPAQYEPARYGSSGRSAHATGTRDGADTSGSGSLRLPDPAPAAPAQVIPAPQPPDARNVAPRPARPGNQGYPTGTAYPAGQGYPTGTAYPSGTRTSVESEEQADREQPPSR